MTGKTKNREVDGAEPPWLGSRERIESLFREAASAERRAGRVFGPGKSVAAAGLPTSDMSRAVGEPGWWRLEPRIQARFASDVPKGRVKRYDGIMSEVICSKAGWLLAQLCRLIGTPLATARGCEVPTTVLVYPDPACGGSVWDRIYAFPGKAPVTVRSSKVLEGQSRMVERVGGGFGMWLRVYEQDRALHMVSQCYFLELFGRRFYLPDLLSPGTAHVIHTDEGQGVFRFRLTITHRLLGTLFRQNGRFSEGRVFDDGDACARALPFAKRPAK